MKKLHFQLLFFIVFQFVVNQSHSQELYVFSEPASNMPAKSLGLKYSGKWQKDQYFKEPLNRQMLELQVGHSKKWMTHLSNTFSNMYEKEQIGFESLGLYTKYRVLSIDALHQHFRAAVFGKVTFSNNKSLYEELSLDGDQSAIESGVVLTQLLHKLALSSTIGLIEVTGKERWAKPVGVNLPSFEGIQYSLSAGYLLYPKSYISYDQTNFNVYVECLGGFSLDRKTSFLDMAPAIQWIIKSNSKLNVGYRFQVSGDAYRMSRETFLISFERTFLNALK